MRRNRESYETEGYISMVEAGPGPGDADADADAGVDAQELADAIGQLLTGEIDADDMDREIGGVANAVSFESAGVLTSDKGVKVELGSGEFAFITVQSQPGR